MVSNDNVKTNLSEAQVYESMGLYAEALITYEKVLIEGNSLDAQTLSEVKDNISELKKKLAQDSVEDTDEEEVSREALSQIKARTPDEKDIAPILDRASVFLEKGLYEEAADEYAMLFSIGYSFTSVIPPIIDFLISFCRRGRVGHELSKVIDKFNLKSDELAEISALFGVEIGKRFYYSSAVGLLEKAKILDQDNENIDKMYATIVDQFLAEPRSVYLIRRTRVNEEDLKKALGLSYEQERSLFYILIENGYIEKGRLLKALSDYHKCPAIEFDPELLPPKKLLSKTKKEILHSQGWVPLDLDFNGSKVVVENPEDTIQSEQIKRLLSTDNIQYCTAVQEDIELLIDHFFEKAIKLAENESEQKPGNKGDGVVMDIVEMLEQKNGWKREQKMSIRPQLISAELFLNNENNEQDSLLVRLKDSPKHGFGILVSSEEYKRLKKIKEGDTLNDIIFYAGWAMVRTKSVVRNVTRIGEGKDKGHYFVEIESEDVI